MYVKGVAKVFHRGGGQGGHLTNARVHPRDSFRGNFENIILDVTGRGGQDLGDCTLTMLCLLGEIRHLRTTLNIYRRGLAARISREGRVA